MKPRYQCGYCGRPLTADQAIYSRHTGNRYCATRQTECERRARQRKETAR